jgi:Rps23 Pro-64 3,4-dihydroxylase Tpa1-like proline 4-hydroxylase
MLSRFVSWLRTPLAAAFHPALAGAPEPPRCLSSASVEVQVARMARGQSFPVHVDTCEEGLTAVYQLTRGFKPDDGGVLQFGEPGLKPRLVVPQLFGGLFLFRPADAPHEVTKIAAPDDRPRLTVTASYLYGDPRR